MQLVARLCLVVAGATAALPAAWADTLPAHPVADAPAATDNVPAVPPRLSETGLFVAGSTQVRAEVLSFSPQYPLWSDGAAKRRWLYLPPGAAIDAAQPDAWVFPPGTRVWKEFSHVRPVETRLIERLADGSWRYAVYIWNADGSDAMLAPSEGVAALPADGAPAGHYTIPSQEDCRACHEGGNVPLLGVSALQLSPDRDPHAPHAEPVRPEHIGLRELIARGLLKNASPLLSAQPPRVRAASPVARAALGYLHANCGHCHNAGGGLAELDLVLAQETAAEADSSGGVLRTTLDYPADTRAFGLDTRVVAGRPAESQLAARMRSRNPFNQMPPLGSRLVDDEALGLVEEWIRQLQNQPELVP